MDLPDLHDDLKHADGLEEFLFYKLGSADERRQSRLVHVRQISAREAAASGGAYTTFDFVMRIPASEFDDFQPEVGSLVESVDRQTVAYVLQKILAVKKTRVMLVCRGSVTVNQLTEAIMLQEPIYSKDTDRSQVLGWKTIGSNLPAFVQEVQNVMVESTERRQVRIDYRVYLRFSDQIRAGMRIIRENGEFLHVQGVAGIGVLGELVVVEATRPAGARAG